MCIILFYYKLFFCNYNDLTYMDEFFEYNIDIFLDVNENDNKNHPRLIFNQE